MNSLKHELLVNFCTITNNFSIIIYLWITVFMLQESYIYNRPTIYIQRNVEASNVIFAPYSYC